MEKFKIGDIVKIKQNNMISNVIKQGIRVIDESGKEFNCENELFVVENKDGKFLLDSSAITKYY